MAPATTAARKHVEEIRRTKFFIGRESNPITKDFLRRKKNQTMEHYAKINAHVLMELIQNADDNEYPEGVDPSLEFVITSKDLTNTGAPATLLVFNNEKGFFPKNIESICSVGRSTKKGIGFKSVFLITSQPYIFSNGYQIRFNEKPCHHCNVSYIVPEWVDKDPTLSSIQSVYGSATVLPTTTLVLPLKWEKVRLVKAQLSSVHPEFLLFLAKLRLLSVRRDNKDPWINTVSPISISSEKDLFSYKCIDALSYTVHLTADGCENGVHNQYGYYMWEQRFPVKQENEVDVRMEVNEWVITLAFPHLKRGPSLPGIFSFLPTETVTNFPFIIQADFLFASSRKDILWDNKWNQGILDCVPVAFLNAFTSLVKSVETAPVSSLPNMFRFLPIKDSSHPTLNHVRDAIKAKLLNETIVPCESYTGKKLFCKPNEVGWVKHAFWSILNMARSQGIKFSIDLAHVAYLFAPSFDAEEYNLIVKFLEIRHVDCEWYAQCISSSNLVMGVSVSEDVYVQLLVFIADGWKSRFNRKSIMNTPLIKYVRGDGKVGLLTLVSCRDKLLAADLDSDPDCISWLINWNREFQPSIGQFFLPKVTQKAIRSCSNMPTLMKWFKEVVKVAFVIVPEYAAQLLSFSVNDDRKLAVTYAHFLYTSLKNDYLMKQEVHNLCSNIPIVDKYGRVTTIRGGARPLVPANRSRWMELFGTNPWRHSDYVELGIDYTRDITYFGGVTSGEELVSFLGTYVGASDVPDILPPNAGFPTPSAPLTKRNAFLLLEWIRNLKKIMLSLPRVFLSSIKYNSLLKVSLSGCPLYRPPSESFLIDSSIGNFLQDGLLPFNIPLIDENFYGVNIRTYKEELQTIGVRIQDSEVCDYIATLVMSLAASSELTRDHVLAILKFIEFLGKNHISCKRFIKSIIGEKWVRTSQGDMTPSRSVLFSLEWNAASQISDIPFIDQDFYGEELLYFKKQLRLTGVVVDFNKSYQLVLDNLKTPSSLTCLSSEAMLLLLRCLKGLKPLNKRVQAIRNTECLKTNLGYRCPSECFLLNPESEWGCLLQVFGSFPVLDEQFYGSSIFSMANELKKIGVMVDFEDVCKEFTRTFKQQALLSSITKEHVISFLQCYRKLKKLKIKFPVEFNNCIRQEKWIHTRLGDYRSPNECILFYADWEPVSAISLLPFIDDSNDFYGNEIRDYYEELKELGVVTVFRDGAKFVAS